MKQFAADFSAESAQPVYAKFGASRPGKTMMMNYFRNRNYGTHLTGWFKLNTTVSLPVEYTPIILSTRYVLLVIEPIHFIFTLSRFSLALIRSFLALLAAGHAGGAPVYHGASLDPEQAQWRVLRAFKVAKYGK